MRYISFLLCITVFSCQSTSPEADTTPQSTPVNRSARSITEGRNTIKERFLIPQGFKRRTPPATTFGYYLQSFPLKAEGEKVHCYNGDLKTTDCYDAVMDIDVGTVDLQQCADAVMRLRAEWLYEQQRYEEIQFHFVSGFLADYKTWRAGNRIKVKDHKVAWVKTNKKSDSYKSFRSYLNTVFMYASTLSLDKELEHKSIETIEIGDVFIKGGAPGHAVIVVDVATHYVTKERKFILAQSYMPAQDIQVLSNYNNKSESPWYSNQKMHEGLFTPEWTFTASQLKTWN